MQKKQWFLPGVALALALVYVFGFSDWFRHKQISIATTSRALFSRYQYTPGTPASVAFALDQQYRLTELKIVPLAAWQTNPAVVPVWHLTSSGKSSPIKFFLYGQGIRGMQPAVPGMKPEPLQDGVVYRAFISAGSVKGQHDFWIGGRPPEATNSPDH